MKKDNTVLIGVLLGLSVGLALLGLRFMGKSTSFVVPLFLGLLVLVLDSICLQPILNERKNRKLLRDGVTTDGIIDEIVTSAIDPKYMVKDEYGHRMPPIDMTNVPAVYTIRITYQAEGNVYTKEAAIPPKTQSEIYPYMIAQGETIPIKYIREKPDDFIIAIPTIMESTIEAQRSLLYKGPFAAFVITAIYVVYLITHVI